MRILSAYIAVGLTLGTCLAGHIIWAWRKAGRDRHAGWARALAVFFLVQAPLVPEWLRAQQRSSEGSLTIVWLALLLALLLYHLSTPNPYVSSARGPSEQKSITEGTALNG